MTSITVLSEAARSGDEKALGELFDLVYGELRKLAGARMAMESPDHTLQPTALVHEVWLKLAGPAGNEPLFQGTSHFLLVASRAMRQILVDHARRKHAAKRGSGALKLDLQTIETAATTESEAVLGVHDALAELAKEDPQAAQLIELRFFAGLGNREAAQAMGISERTAKRYWTFARAWLYQKLHTEEPP